MNELSQIAQLGTLVMGLVLLGVAAYGLRLLILQTRDKQRKPLEHIDPMMPSK